MHGESNIKNRNFSLVIKKVQVQNSKNLLSYDQFSYFDFILYLYD
jgi:hypothetical protein